LPRPLTGEKKLSVRTGDQERVPLRFALPDTLPAGTYQIRATVRFSTGETQEDTFVLDVLPRPPAVPEGMQIALLDPKGETARALTGLNARFERVEASADLSAFDVLIVGKGALTPDGPGPDVGRVRDGLKVIVFEQSAAVLEQRFGFRVAEYGLRQVFPRVPDHPLLAGLAEDHMHDW